MDTLTRRWWAPDAPGIGPDEFDLTLLTPGSEPDKDLGSHLLALHRVGAAACEAVATEPMADEVTLRGVLATARQLIAPPAIEAVSKAVEDGNYGALLLRDFLDDAEQAVVSIYRTCITKQMAPSMAAHRCGLIYGVPLRELGKYTMLATDPKTPKQTVTELADRALFGFVAKVLDEEMLETRKVTISKAPAGERERPRLQTDQLQALFDRSEQSAYLDEHNVANDEATGRFVREETTTAPVGRTALSRPKLSRKVLGRKVLGQPAVSVAEPTAELTRSRLRPAGLRRAQTRQVSMTQARLQSLLPELVVPPTQTGMNRDPDPDLDYLERQPDQNEDSYAPLWASVSFVFPAADWNARKAGMAQTRDEDGNEQLIFRARALAGGGPFQGDDENGHLSGQHHDAREYAVELLRASPDHQGQPKPMTKVLHGAAATIRDRAQLAKAKADFLGELETRLGHRLNRATEMSFVQAAASHDDLDDLVLVWQPPTPGREVLDRPLLLVTEVFIDEEDSRGRAERSRHGADITIDPNQPLRVLGGRSLWRDDDKGGFFIRQLDAHEGYEEDLEQAAKDRARRRGKRGFGKRLVIAKATHERDATQLQQLQGLFDRAESTYLREHHVDNDAETGQFVREGGATARTQLSRPKIGRKVLRRGTVRPAELRQGEPAQLRHSSLTTTGTTKALLSPVALKQAALAAEEGADEQTVFLDDGFDYVVLDHKQLGFMLDEANVKYLEKAYEEPFAPGFGTTALIGDKWRSSGADQARMDLISEAELRFRDAPTAGWRQLGSSYHITSDKDLPAIAFDIEDQLGRDPKIQMLRSVIHRRGEEYVITIHGNAEDMGDGHMIRLDGPVKSPIRLRPEGPRRLTGPRGIEYWLNLRFHGGKHIGATGSTDYLPVPLVHTWVAEDHYDAP